MSDRPCNYCNIQSMKETAKLRGVELIVQVENVGDMRGWVSARYSDDEEPCAYFMEVGMRCAC